MQEDNPDFRSSLRSQETAHRNLLTERVIALNQSLAVGSGLAANQQETQQSSASTYAQIRHRLHRGLLELLNPQAVGAASLQQIQAAVEEYVLKALEEESLPLSRPERNRLVEDLMYEVLGLGPLSPLMTDATVSDILVNGPHQVYVERHGLLEPTEIHFHDNDHLMLTIERILSRVGRRVDESSPMADARLADGSRVNVIIPPLAVKGPTMSIRRFMRNILDMRELVGSGAMTAEAAEFLKAAVYGQLNIIISGGTGSGKTTMLNCLSQHVGEGERVVTIEDTAELQLNHKHLVQLEARPSNTEGRGAVSIRDLVRNSLRMRPDRIIVGEVRGAEALDMLQAMNTGHDGSLATLHSNSPRDTLSRLETMMLMAELDLPQRVLREQIGSAVQLIVHVNRYSTGERKVSHISEIVGTDNGVILMQDIFTTRREGERMMMRACGIIPNASNLLAERGIELDSTLFKT
ncbi:CpaF family protein [Pseudomethylobacillus aquaticus]|uniref:CpaF family protein n=1 Tax=Pseudomethylobacillus aquaticus TaxID=2676064 RepID=A0A3N0UXZ9_9PROT|nr:CpaF family protein [Pseudomethylobacillus aquaticus]ROH85333.1 CpaF family protein [Pseudomethylobacillus aquaticus]